MKVFEILNFNREPLKRLQQAGIRIEDVEYIDLYNDYRVMLGVAKRSHTLWRHLQIAIM